MIRFCGRCGRRLLTGDLLLYVRDQVVRHVFCPTLHVAPEVWPATPSQALNVTAKAAWCLRYHETRPS